MRPIQFYELLTKELRFPQLHGGREDYIRGSILGGIAATVLGLPLLLGYLTFLLRGQIQGMDFLPPIEPEHIGDYAYEGIKYSLSILGFILFVMLSIFGLVSVQTAPLARLVAICGLIMLSTYLLPLTFLWFAKTGHILPLSKSELKEFSMYGISFAYLTVWMVSLLISLVSTLLLTIFSLLVVTLPLAFFFVWYQAVIYTRYLGMIETGAFEEEENPNF